MKELNLRPYVYRDKTIKVVATGANDKTTRSAEELDAASYHVALVYSGVTSLSLRLV